jgi:L-lactate dehydrogenase complex protein LldF
MEQTGKIFLKKSVIAFNRKHRKTLRFNISRYDESVLKGKKRWIDLEQAKLQASYIREKTLNNLSFYLLEFERNISARGINVAWARNGREAMDEIISFLKQNKVNILVKSKSMISEEIGFNEEAVRNGIESVETDLGEFIVQEAGEKPYHILTPAMHKSKEDVAALFHRKFNTPGDLTPEEITGYVRKLLRQKFTRAQVGVTGANFIVADTGAISLTENEGNGLMSVSFPEIHIVLAGIERVIPSINDLPLFLTLLATHGTGQQLSAYNSLVSGPRKNNETDGPEKMMVILLDNGRSRLIKEKEAFLALKCIRCGACLNACPIYKNVGGYTYGSTYTGPIGSVITPFYNGFDKYNHLSYACSVCGRCSEVCPVKIPLHDLLLLNRKRTVDENMGSFLWNTGMKGFGYVFENRKRLDFFPGHIKNRLLKVRTRILGDRKVLPAVAPESFSQLWKNQKINS